VFVPGETIPIEIKVHNPTKKAIDAIKIKLKREVRVKARHVHSHKTEEIESQVFQGCGPQQSVNFVANYRITENIYPSTCSDLVSSNYFLIVDGDVKMAFDVKVEADVVIALLPAPSDRVTIFGGYTGGVGYWDNY